MFHRDVRRMLLMAALVILWAAGAQVPGASADDPQNALCLPLVLGGVAMLPTPTLTPEPTATPGSDLAIYGVVYDGSVGPAMAVPEAAVAVAMCAGISRSFQTVADTDGTYTLVVPALYANACTVVTLVAWADGYEQYSEQLTVADLRASPRRDIPLGPTQ